MVSQSRIFCGRDDATGGKYQLHRGILNRLKTCRPADVANQKSQCCRYQEVTALELPQAIVTLADG